MAKTATMNPILFVDHEFPSRYVSTAVVLRHMGVPAHGTRECVCDGYPLPTSDLVVVSPNFRDTDCAEAWAREIRRHPEKHFYMDIRGCPDPQRMRATVGEPQNVLYLTGQCLMDVILEHLSSPHTQ